MNPVDATDVTRTFGALTAVDGVSISVRSGEVVGLLGANGAGKTTLIKMILGLLRPTAGRILLFGRPQARELRARIGYVPRISGCTPTSPQPRTSDLRRCLRGRYRRAARHRRRPRSGHVARHAAARRLRGSEQHHPDLFVLDEPTSGVSPLARSDLWDLIRDRAEVGAAVLVSTHYMDEAEQADRLVVMADGLVVAEGSVTDVIGGRQTVEVVTDHWSEAFTTLDRGGRRVTLAGRNVRVLSETIEAVSTDLEHARVVAAVDLVPATLDETLVELGP